MSRPLEAVFGNWQMSAIVIRQAGPPLLWGNIIFIGNPDQMRLPKGDRDVDRWFNIDSGFNKISGQALSSNIRTFPMRLASVQADGQAKWDIGLAKGFRMGERAMLKVRAQIFNIMNHPNFGAPNVSPTSAAFGQITATAGLSRQVQAAATITF
jgi:hypothetical protein